MTSTLDGADRDPEPTLEQVHGAPVEISSVSLAYEPGVPVVQEVDLKVEGGRICSLLGPSGSGKTSLLRAIAGLEHPTSGTIQIGPRVVSDERSWVQPEHRSIGMVFQDGALFPHLTVAANIAFGLRGVGRAEAAERVEALLAMVDLEGYGDRLPSTLSGGQQQRVALARSLAPRPSVLLLDEPFSALDAALRVQIRSEVSQIIRDIGVTTIFVTHDQDEAFVLGDEVAVMRDGRIEQTGTPDDIYRRPASPWVAGFVGEANLLPGSVRADGAHATTPLGTVPLRTRLPAESTASILIRPEQIGLTDGDTATIESVEYYGHDARYDLVLDDGTTVAARATSEAVRHRGDRVGLRLLGGPAEAWPTT